MKKEKITDEKIDSGKTPFDILEELLQNLPEMSPSIMAKLDRMF